MTAVENANKEPAKKQFDSNKGIVYASTKQSLK